MESQFLSLYLSVIVSNHSCMESSMHIEPWFSVEEIAKHLGLSKETIYRWLERQKIPAHRIGKLWKFKPSEVDTWIKEGGARSVEQSEERP